MTAVGNTWPADCRSGRGSPRTFLGAQAVRAVAEHHRRHCSLRQRLGEPERAAGQQADLFGQVEIAGAHDPILTPHTVGCASPPVRTSATTVLEFGIGSPRPARRPKTRPDSCGAGAEEDQNGTQKIVVVGGVAGGMSAAARARRLSEDAHIVVLERDAYVSFANCGMPYHIGGDIPDRDELLVQTLRAWPPT